MTGIQLMPRTMKLHYSEYGSGEPLIILHGFLGASGNWHTLSRKVFAEHFHVYTVDQRNHGRSPHDDRFDYETMAEDLVVFMDEHGIDKAHVVGHSMGGKTAMYFASMYPERTDRLVVVDMTPRRYDAQHNDILEALKRVDFDVHTTRDDIDGVLAETIEEVGTRMFLMKNLAIDRETKRFSWQMNLPVLDAQYDQLNEPLPKDARFEGPTLFIRGVRSNYIRDEDRDLIEHHFPNARVLTIKDAGHWVHADQPAIFGESVVTYLQRED